MIPISPCGSRFPLFNLLAAIAAFLVCLLAYATGLLYNLFCLLPILFAAVGIVSRLWGAWRKTLETRFVTNAFRRPMRPYLLQCANRWLFWLLLAATLPLAIPTVPITPGERRDLIALLWGATGVLLVLALIPHRRVFLATNLLFALGSLFLAMQLARIVRPPRFAEGVVLNAPFRGEWYVVHGGRSVLFNHHYALPQQRDALDLIRLESGQSVRGDPNQRDSYAAWGQPLYAPADGIVVRARDDRPDMAVGQSDLDLIIGNHVVLDMGNGRFVLMAHLQKNSVEVVEGQRVTRGQPLARCGNSGNTSEPHLHLQVQNRADFDAPDLRTFPIFFRDIIRVRGETADHLPAAYVRRNDRIQPL